MNVRLPAPLNYYNRENEAETRRIMEQAFATFGAQGQQRFAELSADALAVLGDLTVGGTLRVTGEATMDDDLFVGSPAGAATSGYRSLVVKGGNGGFLDLTDADGDVRATLSTDNTGGDALFIDTRTDHPIVFRPNVVEKMRLSTGGRLTVTEAVRAGFSTRPAEVTSTRVTADTAVWASVLPASTSFVCAMVSIRDATNGGSALIYADVNGGAVVVSSRPGTSTVVVSGTPAATEIGVRISGTDLQVLAGSSRDGVLVDTMIMFSVL